MDHVMREVKLVYCNTDPVGFGRNLNNGVDDATVILRAVFGSQDKETV